MSSDWSKYPLLPKPPQLPQWRDTPEREAYWAEVCAIETPAEKKSGCFTAVFLWIVFTAVLLSFVHQYDFWTICGSAIATLVFVWIVWYLFFRVCFCILKRKISKKYGFSIRKLNRPDLSSEIAAVLITRPDFSETEFRKYWQNPEQAAIAEKILKIANQSWYLHKKMLYPNDPLLLLFYGRAWRWGKEKMIAAPEEFFIDVEDSLNFFEENWDAISTETTTLSEIVEYCQLDTSNR
ncbi:MAG: hypothetical protein E7042_02205 [Lentisphaerae bacterium]|nr:hypothetical protein [Lentisphaerota bacterium]